MISTLDRSSVVAAAGVSPLLVGRRRELGRLEAAFEQARTGQPSVVLLSGVAGVGKTRLIDEFRSQHVGSSATFLRGSCRALGRGELPFAPVLEACQNLDLAVLRDVAGAEVHELARLLPELSDGQRWLATGTASAQAQTWFSELFLSLLGRLSRDRPVVLVLEDLHWADRSTLELVSYLVRSLRDEAVLLVLTYRDEFDSQHPLRASLLELQRSDMVETLQLPLLDHDQTAEQIGAILDAPAPPFIVDLAFGRGGGNPFFTEELLAAVSIGGLDDVPSTLRDLLIDKVRALSPYAREVVQVVAAVGRPTSHELLAAIVRLDAAGLEWGLQEAARRQLVIVGGTAGGSAGRCSLRHEIVQEAVYSDLPNDQRRRLHAALAEVLHDRPELSPLGGATAAAEVAHHWYAAHDQAKSLEAALLAATAAEEVYAYSEAFSHLTRAIDLWPLVRDAELVAKANLLDLLERTGRIAGLIGEYDRAVEMVRQAIELAAADARTDRSGSLYEQLGSYLVGAGDADGAAAAYEQAITRLAPGSADRAVALAEAGHLALLCSRYGEATALAEEARALARELDDQSTEARSLGTLGVVAAHQGDLTTSVTLMRRAITAAKAAGDGPALASLYINFGHVLGLAGRLDEAVATSVDGLEAMRRLGLKRQGGTYLKCNAAWALFKRGQWEEAGTLWREATAGGMRGVREVSLLLACAELDTAQGRFASARQRLDRAAAICQRGWAPLFYQRELAEQQAELAVWEGRSDEAAAAVDRGLRLVRGTEDERFGGKLILLGVRAEADRGGDAGRLTDLVATAHGFRPSPLDPEACRLPEAVAVAATLQAELARARAEPDPELWVEAGARWRHLRRPYPTACARWREGEARAAQGDRAGAAAAFEQALLTARQLGAAPLAMAIEAAISRS